MRKLILIVIILQLIGCGQKKKDTLTIGKIEIPYLRVEQSIELDDGKSLALYLKNGFNPNYINKEGETLLMEVVKTNSLKCLEVLLNYDIDIDEETVIRKGKNTTAYLPTKRAIDYVKSRKALKLLLEKKATINYRDNLKDPLIIKFIKNKPLYYVKELLKEDIDLDVRDKDGWTPLMWAINRNNLQLVSLILKKGKGINKVDKDGNSGIFYCYDKDILNYLLDQPIDMTLVNKDGENILGEVYLRAISNSYYQVVEKILKKGFDKNYSSYGDTPMKIGKEKKDKEMVDLLKKYDVDNEL